VVAPFLFSQSLLQTPVQIGNGAFCSSALGRLLAETGWYLPQSRKAPPKRRFRIKAGESSPLPLLFSLVAVLTIPARLCR